MAATWTEGLITAERYSKQIHAAMVVLGRGGGGEKYMPQIQHNMWITNAKTAVLSIITGGGKWVEITIPADCLYQHLLLTAEKKFWRCVQSGEPPRLFGVEPPRPRIEAVRIVDMSASNSWAECAAVFRTTRTAYLEHEKAKAELKGLMPEDAKEAIGQEFAPSARNRARSASISSTWRPGMQRSSETMGRSPLRWPKRRRN